MGDLFTMSQKEIEFPVTLKCAPVDFYSVEHLRDIASELYPEGNQVILEFLGKLEEL